MSRKRRPKNGPPWWLCEQTGKRGYRSKLDALSVASTVVRKYLAQRAYHCEFCGRFHLTSQEKRGAR